MDKKREREELPDAEDVPEAKRKKEGELIYSTLKECVLELVRSTHALPRYLEGCRGPKRCG